MMKNIKLILLGFVFLAFACEDGYIDDITPVDPGPDVSEPVVDVVSPSPVVNIPFTEQEAVVNLEFLVVDDIEIESITVNLNGSQIASFSEFLDFRRFEETLTSDALGIGVHELEIVAVDVADKTTTEIYNFEITNIYSPRPGEVFYMPFEGESFLDLISETTATEAGQVTFRDGIAFDAAHFDGSAESYLLFDPGTEIVNTSDLSLSFWTNVEFVDEDNSGGIDGIIGLVNLSNVSNFWGNLDFFIENGSNPTDGADMRIHITNDDSETWITNVNDVQGIFGAWAHHVLTYDDSSKEFKYYINGNLMTTAAASWADNLNFTNSGPMVMGTVHFQTDPSLTSATGSQPWASYLTGELDEVRIFSKALNQSEVTDLFNATN
jgi:hypothetical protein